MNPIRNPFAGREGYNCFGCSPDNPIGLRMIFEREGDSIVTTWSPGNDYQGWHKILHGGIQATLIDEIGSWLVFTVLGRGGVTSRLEVKYKKAVEMDKGPVRLVAQVAEDRRRVVDVNVLLYDGEGVLCTEGLASYYIFDGATAMEKLFYPGAAAFGSEKA